MMHFFGSLALPFPSVMSANFQDDVNVHVIQIHSGSREAIRRPGAERLFLFFVYKLAQHRQPDPALFLLADRPELEEATRGTGNVS